MALTLPPPLPEREGREQFTPPPARGGQGEGGIGYGAGLLYGADLAGGCLGALLGAALFVPVLGIPHTCAAIALAALAGLIALL